MTIVDQEFRDHAVHEAAAELLENFSRVRSLAVELTDSEGAAHFKGAMKVVEEIIALLGSADPELVPHLVLDEAVAQVSNVNAPLASFEAAPNAETSRALFLAAQGMLQPAWRLSFAKRNEEQDARLATIDANAAISSVVTERRTSEAEIRKAAREAVAELESRSATTLARVDQANEAITAANTLLAASSAKLVADGTAFTERTTQLGN